MQGLTQNRKHSKIDKLPPDQKDTVEQMLLAGATYAEVVQYLDENGVQLSQASVCRYAKGLAKNVALVNIAGTNFQRMMDEMAKYPKLDTAEVIIRLASQNIFNTLAEMEPDEWKQMEPKDLLRQANALIRATAYKSHVDLKNQNITETGLEEVKALVFDSMAKEKPKLYSQVVAFLNDKKDEAVP